MLTVKQVAERLQVHPITVRRWIYSGKLRAVRTDGAVRIEESALREFIDNHSTAKNTQ